MSPEICELRRYSQLIIGYPLAMRHTTSQVLVPGQAAKASERRTDLRLAGAGKQPLTVFINGCPLHTTNVSQSGLQLAYPAAEFQLLSRRLRRDGIEIDIQLPGGRHIDAKCRVVYDYPAADVVLMGLEFRGFSLTGKSLWEAYLDSVS